MTKRATIERIADFLRIDIRADTAARSCETIPRVMGFWESAHPAQQAQKPHRGSVHPVLLTNSPQSIPMPKNDPAFCCMNFQHASTKRSGCKRIVLSCLVSLLVAANASASPPHETEMWFLISFDGNPVGFEHVKTRTDSAQSLQSCYRKTELYLNRMGQNLTLRASLWTTQTQDGQLRTFNLQRVDGAGSRIERSGTFILAKAAFDISELVAGTRRNFSVAVPEGTRSPIFSVWLPQLSSTLNKRLNLPVFFPETAGVATIAAERKTDSQIRMNNKPLRTRRIQFYPAADATKSTTLYTDNSHSVLRQEKMFLSRTLSMQRTSAEVALTASTAKSLDLDVQTTIPIDRLLSGNKDQTTRVLELRVSNGFLPVIPNATFQAVQPIDGSAVRITLLPPNTPMPKTRQDVPPNHPALASSRWMPISDPALRRIALLSAGAENSSNAICRRLEAAVHKKMRRSVFSTVILPADMVIKTFKGDCTEHAILLATLIRIKGIPARIATGIVHTNQQYGFVGHAWVEALIEGRWVAFDSAVGHGGTGITYIKLQDSNMPDTLTSGVSLFLPILELAGRASVSVISE